MITEKNAVRLLDVIETVQVQELCGDVYVGLVVPGIGFCSAKMQPAARAMALQWGKERDMALARATAP